MKRVISIALCFLMVFALCPSATFAASTMTWSGSAGDGSWHTAGNWDSGQVPGDGDYVIIPEDSIVEYAEGETSVRLNCAGNLTVSGGTLKITNPSPYENSSLINGKLDGEGDITITEGSNLSWNGGSIEGSGSLILENNANLYAIPSSLDRYLVNNGALLISGGSLRLTGGAEGSGNFSIQENKTLELGGNKSYNLSSNVVNMGTLKISDSCTSVNFNSGYTQQNTGTLEFDIGGLSDFTQLEVTGNAILNGELKINILGGYNPSAGDTFEIMTCGSRTGEFASISSNTDGITFEPTYTDTGLTLTVSKAATVWEVANATQLENALNGFQSGDTIKLTADFTYNKGIIIDGKNITFDTGSFTLNVYNVYSSADPASGVGLEVKNGGNVYLIGSGQLYIRQIGGNTAYGVKVTDGSTAMVTNVQVTVYEDDAAIGVYADGTGSSIHVLGNVHVMGESGCGAKTGGRGKITVEGTITAMIYINIDTTYKDITSGVDDPEKPGYLKYSNEPVRGIVWVKAPSVTVPTVPQNFTATPGDGQVELSWEAPDSDGGAVISHYEVSADDGTTWVTASTSTSHTFTGLTNGMEYTFKVRAVNSEGPGAEASATATPVAPATPVPTQPGQLYTWGNNVHGQLGDGTLVNKSIPTHIGTAEDWTTVSAGYRHTVALKSDGSMWAWGDNHYGQLGDGTDELRKNSPVQIGSDNDWAAVETGEDFTVALKTDGSLWAWGNAVGGYEFGTEINRNVPTLVDNENVWIAVSAGRQHTVAVRSDGSLWGWGWNSEGELGPNGLESYTSYTGSPVQISDDQWAAVSAGTNFTVGLKEDGSLWTWGWNNVGQLGLGNVTDEYKDVPTRVGSDTWLAAAAGDNHVVAIKADGSLWAWGGNEYGELGNGSSDGIVDPPPHPVPAQIGTDTDWISVTTGDNHNAAFKTDGSLWLWGLNGTGQMGDGTSGTAKTVPQRLDGAGTWLAVACGGSHTVATLEAGLTVPAVPQNFTATPGDGQVELSWEAPASDGGAAIDHYEVSEDDGTTWVTASTSTSHTFTGLTNGLEYIFKVRAVNSEGPGAEASATATPVAPEFAGGSGSEEDPYLVANADQLYNVRNHLDKHFQLIEDIDLSGYSSGQGWNPIGSSADPFTGTFDGDGHTISNLYIDKIKVYMSYVSAGLFGNTGAGAEISNLTLESADVTGCYYVGSLVGRNNGNITNVSASGSVSGEFDTGGLVGRNYGSITDSAFIGTVTGTDEIEYGEWTGGFVGYNSGTITNCRADVTVVSEGDSIGGLVGENLEEGIITESCSTGTITGDYYSGGLVGANSGQITACYSTCTVNGNSDVGGLVGANNNQIMTCYSTGMVNGNSNVGGLVGDNLGPIVHSFAVGKVEGTVKIGGLVGCGYGEDVTSSYWDKESSLVNISAGGTGKLTADMKQQATYVGWDFTTIWDIEAGRNNGYPFLRWQGEEPSSEPPVLSETGANAITQTTAALCFTLNKAGTYYYLVYEATQAAPDEAAIKDQGAAAAKGTGAAVAAVNNIAVTGLTASTEYKAYLIVEDEEGNISSIALISFTTTTAAPTYALTITAGTGGSITSGSSGNYEEGAVINIAAVPASGYSFDQWTSVGGGTFGSITSVSTTFTMPANTVTITAGFKHSGGGGSGGGESTSPASVYEADVETESGTETTLPVTVDPDAGNASVDTDSQTFAQGGTVISIPSIPGVDTYSVGIPVPDLSTADLQSTLTLNTGAGSISVPSNMLSGVAEADGNKAQISIGQGDKSTLPEDIKTAIGDRPLIQLALSIDGNQTDWSNPNAPVTVAIPYTPTPEELARPEHITVWYIDGSGRAHSMNGQYDAATGTVVFTTTHFSYYAVVYDSVIRLAGSDRVDTSLRIARAAYRDQISNAVLATANNYPDALAGSVLAYQLDAPLLLVGSSEKDQAKVLSYLKDNLKPEGTVYILGGTGVISQSFADKVSTGTNAAINRIMGSDRYDTSVKIAEQLNVKTGTPVVLASGENYPDALAVSSIAANNQLPVLLVQKDRLSEGVAQKLARIKPGKIYIIGLEGAISPAVVSQAAKNADLTAENVVRIGGADRYATSLAIAEYFDLGSGTLCLATGNNYPDSLAGSVYAAKYKAPIILTDSTLPTQMAAYIESGKPAQTVLFGGEAAVGKTIEQQIRNLLKQ